MSENDNKSEVHTGGPPRYILLAFVTFYHLSFPFPLPLSAWVSFQGKSLLELLYSSKLLSFFFSPPFPSPILANKPNEQSEPRKSMQLKAYREWQSTFSFIHNPSSEPKCTMVSWISNFKLVALKICWSSLRLFILYQSQRSPPTFQWKVKTICTKSNISSLLHLNSHSNLCYEDVLWKYNKKIFVLSVPE